MASKTEEALIEKLALHRAMQLDKYQEPMPLDRKKALDETTDRTRFDQPIVHAWTVSVTREPLFGWFTKARDSVGDTGKAMLARNWYDTPVNALIAHRNHVAPSYAKMLLDLDTAIGAHLAGSGILPGVIVSKADMTLVEPAAPLVGGEDVKDDEWKDAIGNDPKTIDEPAPAEPEPPAALPESKTAAVKAVRKAPAKVKDAKTEPAPAAAKAKKKAGK